MPRCEGRSDGPGAHFPCPDNRCDSTVRGRQGELMLCDNCTEYRFPTCTKNTVKKTGKSRSTTSSSTSTICTRGKQLQRDATPALSVAEPVTVISNTASRSSSCSDTDTMPLCDTAQSVMTPSTIVISSATYVLSPSTLCALDSLLMFTRP